MITKEDYIVAVDNVYGALEVLKDLMSSPEYEKLRNKLDEDDAGLMYGSFEAFVECDLTCDHLV